MKLGLGLYRQMLKRDNYRFARQAGCTHLVAHLVDYFADQVIVDHFAFAFRQDAFLCRNLHRHSSLQLSEPHRTAMKRTRHSDQAVVGVFHLWLVAPSAERGL